MREKHKMLTFYLQSCFFCHTESKNVATTLICATGSHTKKPWLAGCTAAIAIILLGGEKKIKETEKRQKKE